MSRFKAGQEVICIDDNFDPNVTSKWFERLPTKGKQYTIRNHRPDGAESGVLLVEITNSPKYFEKFKGKLEPAFNQNRFISIEELDKVFEEEIQKEKEELIEI